MAQCEAGGSPWRLWGPYLSERQWGTVREDYSPHGSAWDYFSHDQARSRAYRWGEDGLAGFSDDGQRLCVAIALWNGKDPVLKERLFGLTNSEGNHGEDVKELYYYLDGTPTHSYMRMLYKYPQGEFPYAALVEGNRRRGVHQPEHEIHDTDAFADDRYFDVQVEYAKAGPSDLLLRVTVINRGPEAARVHVLPHVWFRNTWSWRSGAPRPRITKAGDGSLTLEHAELGRYRCWIEGDAPALLCENETNVERLYGSPRAGPSKDGINNYVVNGDAAGLSRGDAGTKAAFHCEREVPPGGSIVVRMRLSAAEGRQPFEGFDATVGDRLREADRFYEDLLADVADAESRRVARQAFGGMLWSKQYFYYDVPQWLAGDPAQPKPPAERLGGRNREWDHLNNADVISMPDKWEYPWYAAWDLAFHCIPLARLDPGFAKDQLVLLTREWYMHPNGQLPAYEWALGDVNPPVHAWATWRVFEIDRAQRGGRGDVAFLERVFHKLMLNFTWWVNRKDEDGRNIFQGGFLGLDNIGVFDRSSPLPTGGHIDQADGTSWMAMYSLNLMRIALELARHNHVYEDIATKFFEHFLHIAEAMNNIGGAHVGLWDEQDQFFYDVLHTPEGGMQPMRLRTMVGLIPLFAVEVIDGSLLDELPDFKRRLDWYLSYKPELAALVSRWNQPGEGGRRLVSLLRAHRMKAVIRRLLDETEFLSDHGVRAMSRAHLDAPYSLWADGRRYTVGYTPGESDSGLFGGNSNWRGPVWFPVNYLIVESLRTFHRFYGDKLTIECPTGSGVTATLAEAAQEIARRLSRIFLPDHTGRRPVYGHAPLLRDHPDFRDHVLFYEYFHGDTGRGVGASHQTGWTGLIASLLMEYPGQDAARRNARAGAAAAAHA
ncbi:MAG: glucosidase [Planctomyces sp.]|nr:glucosidase [Planctomyces sp.]MBA4038777.1 glucosidase [Planctomyces sp.]MBA4120164.1 glucosidase [Isosphaera sp.]